MNKKFILMSDSIKKLRKDYDTLQNMFMTYQLSDLSETQRLYNNLNIEMNKRLDDSIRYEQLIESLKQSKGRRPTIFGDVVRFLFVVFAGIMIVMPIPIK